MSRTTGRALRNPSRGSSTIPATLVPSGDHDGCIHWRVVSVSRRGSASSSSGSTTKRSTARSRSHSSWSDADTSNVEPSGDHRGVVNERGPVVTCRGASVPSVRPTKTCWGRSTVHPTSSRRVSSVSMWRGSRSRSFVPGVTSGVRVTQVSRAPSGDHSSSAMGSGDDATSTGSPGPSTGTTSTADRSGPSAGVVVRTNAMRVPSGDQRAPPSDSAPAVSWRGRPAVGRDDPDGAAVAVGSGVDPGDRDGDGASRPAPPRGRRLTPTARCRREARRAP